MSQTGTQPLIDSQEITRAFSLFTRLEQVIEVRLLEATTYQNNRYKTTYSGYFDNATDLIRELGKFSSAMGIYASLQVCSPDLLHRAENKLLASKTTTSDKEITRYAWLMIDVDVDRVSGISTTNQQHDEALQFLQHIVQTLVH